MEPSGAECDAVGLCKGVVDEECCAGVWAEAVACCGQLWSGVGEGIEPGVVRVCEEDVASFGMHSNVVDSVEVSTEVVVEQDVGLVCGGVEGADRDSLLGAADGVVASTCAPYDQAVSECSAVRRVDWWV